MDEEESAEQLLEFDEILPPKPNSVPPPPAKRVASKVPPPPPTSTPNRSKVPPPPPRNSSTPPSPPPSITPTRPSMPKATPTPPAPPKAPPPTMASVAPTPSPKALAPAPTPNLIAPPEHAPLDTDSFSEELTDTSFDPVKGISVPPIPSVSAIKSGPTRISTAPRTEDGTSPGVIPAANLVTSLPSIPPPPLPLAEAQEKDAKTLIGLLQGALIKSPNTPQAARIHFDLACLYERMEDRVRAADHYCKAVESAPEHVPSIRGARRVLVANKKFDKAFEYFDREIDATANKAQRAEVFLEKARYLEGRMKNKEEARKAYAQGAALSNSPALLKSLSRCDSRTQAWTDVSDTTAKLAELTEDPQHRAALLSQRARIADVYESDQKRATELFGSALSLDPETRGALSELKRLSADSQNNTQLTQALTQEAQSSSPAIAGRAYFQIARIQADEFEDKAAAIRTLEKATDADPTAIAYLSDLYREAERFDDLTGTLAELYSLRQSKEEKLAIAHELGVIHRDQRSDPGAARVWFETALSLSPNFEPSLISLSNLYRQSGEWEKVVQRTLAAAQQTLDLKARATMHADAATIYERHLSAPPEAVNNYKMALALDPSQVASFHSLTRLLTAAAQWTDLNEIYLQASEQAESKEVAIAHLFRIAAVCEEQIKDMKGAIHAYKAILAKEPHHLGAIHALQRVAEREGDEQTFLTVLELEVGLTQNDTRRVELLSMAASIERRSTGNEQAIARLRTLLSQAPEHAGALRQLASLYQETEQYDKLVDVFKTQLKASSKSEEKVRHIHEIARINEHQLNQPSAAIAAYQHALTLDPQHEASYNGLSRLLTATKDFEGLAKAIVLRIKGLSDPRDIAHYNCELAHVYEAKLSRNDMALQAYEQAAKAVPDYTRALDARDRLLIQGQDYQQLAEELVERIEVSGDLDMATRLSWVLLDREHDAESASQTLELALSNAPSDVSILLSLEQALLEQDDPRSLVEHYQMQARVLKDASMQVAALKEALRLSPKAALHDEVLKRDPKDRMSLRAKLQEASAEQNYGAVVLFAERLATELSDPKERAQHVLLAAEAREATKDPATLDAYRRALDLDGRSWVATRGFSRTAIQLNDLDALREAALRETEVTSDIAMSVDLLRRSAAGRRQAGDVEGAASDYAKALDLDPSHPDLSKELAAVMGPSPRLIELLGRAADGAKPASRAADLYVEVSTLHAGSGDLTAAIKASERALAKKADHYLALSQRADYLEQTSQWKEAMSALDATVRHPEVQNAKGLHLRLARIAQDKLGETPKALASLRVVLKQDEGNQECLERMAVLLAQSGSTAEARKMTDQLIKSAPNSEAKARALLVASDVEQAQGNVAKAAEAARNALILQGPGGEADERSQRFIAESAASWDDHLAALVRGVEHALRTRKPTAPIYLAVASIQGDRLNRADHAVTTLREGLSSTPDDVSLWRALIAWLQQTGSFVESIKHIRQLLQRDVTGPDTWRYLSAAFQSIHEEHEALAVGSALLVLGAADAEESVALRGRQPCEEVPTGLMGDAGMRQIQIDGAYESKAGDVISVLSQVVGKLYPVDLKSYGLSKRDRLQAGDTHPMRIVLDGLLQSFGATELDLYIYDGNAGDVSVGLTGTPALFVPSWAERLSTSGQRFFLGRFVASHARGLLAVHRARPADLAVIVSAAGHLVSPGFTGGVKNDEEIERRSRDVSKAIPFMQRKTFDLGISNYIDQPVNIESWAWAAIRSATRAALLISDDLPASMALVSRITGDSPGPDNLATHLMQFWGGDIAFRFRKAVRELPPSSVPH